MTRSLNTVLTLGLMAVFGVVIYLLISYFGPGEDIDVEQDGRTVSKVVNVELEKVFDFRVLRLKGTTQGAACVVWWKVLNPCRVFKAPFEIDYYVDASKLELPNFRWNEKAKTLLIDAPDVRTGSVNVDTAKIIVDKTDGVFIPRGAMVELQKRSSTGAHKVVQQEAEKEANVDAARRNARTAIESLFSKPLRAAGLNVNVQVRFAGEARPSTERWDTSRALQDVLGNAN